MKILILKPSSLGDVIHALPVLRLLKSHFTQSEIYWWISSDLVSLLKGDPDLAGIIPFNRRRWTNPVYWAEPFEMVQHMRHLRFDWVIDLQSLARSALCAWFAKGEFTIGLEDYREGAPPFYDVAIRRPSPTTHAADWYLEVLRHFKIPIHFDFEWLPKRPEAIESVQRKWSPAADRWIILNPGARWDNKRWPVQHFRNLAAQLTAAYPDLRIAILGGNGDIERGAAIAEANPARCLNLTGKTSLAEMIEWIRLSELMVTNDTGPMHVAAALRKPITALFGPTDARRTGPYGQIQNVMRIPLPCSPCLKARCDYHRPLECLNAIQAEDVFENVKATLK